MENRKEYIECECGTHILQVSTDIEIYENGINNVVTDKTRVNQTYYLAMYNYGYREAAGWKERLIVTWKYLRTGKMYSDQIVMTPDEAQKLTKFITDTIVPTEK